MSTIGLLPEEKTRKMHGRRVSEETIYSVQTTHSNPYHRNIFLQRRANKNDTLSFKSSGNSYVAQRVLSAKVLRVKELQNELQEVKAKLHEVMSENKLLRNLQKRQDTALARYEDTSAALPRLLENHRAEVITLKAHAREVRAAARSLHRKLQRSEAELIHLREEHDKLKQIVEDKDLENRVELQKRVEDLEDRLSEIKEKNLNLNRKLEVEQKSHSQQLAVEINKKKNLQKELQAALTEIARLTRIIEQGQYSSRFGEGDNGSQVTSNTGHLTSRSTKVSQKKLGLQKNLATNSKKKFATPTESKIAKNIDNPKGKQQIKYLEEIQNEAETDTYVELNTKITVESLGGVLNENEDKTLATHIIDGIKCAELEYFHKQEEDEHKETEEYGNIARKENNATHNNILSKNTRKPINEKTCNCIKNSRHGKSNEILSEDEAEAEDDEKKVNYNWDMESKSNVNSGTSQTSCERTESKSSDRPETNISSLDSYEVQNTTAKIEDESDSSVEDSTIKIRIKRDLYRCRKSKAEVDLDENSDSNDKNETNDSKLDICLSSYPSRYTKTTKNNLTKIQNHLDQLDDDVLSYMENKISRNKNNLSNETNENVIKQRQFGEYIKKLENIDRMNENLTSIRDQFKEKQLDTQSQNDSGVTIKQKQYDDLELSSDELNKKDDNFQQKYPNVKDKNIDLEISKRRTKKSSQSNDIDLSSFDPDKYLQEIDSSYKLIRKRINEENEKMNEQLQQYCKDIESDVQKTNEAVDKQKQHLKINQLETEKLERDIRTNVKINDQLKLTRIDSSKKNQLLAALKAIDHGQDINDFSTQPSSIDVAESTSRRRIDKKQLMKDLFE